MDESILEQIRKDISFLLSFVPAKDPSQVEKGLAPMFYVTGTYDGDVELARRAQEIQARYGIIEENPEEEDYEGIE
jgi:hypothetical protein